MRRHVLKIIVTGSPGSFVCGPNHEFSNAIRRQIDKGVFRRDILGFLVPLEFAFDTIRKKRVPTLSTTPRRISF